MSMLDAQLQLSNAQALTATGVSYVYDMLTGDLLKSTTFNRSPNAVTGNAKYFGEDFGIGAGVGTPRIIVGVGTQLASAGKTATLTVAFQTAPNNDTAQASGLLSDLVFTTASQTDAIAEAALLAGVPVASFDWPKRAAGAARPRFIRLDYTVGTENFTSGTINADIGLVGPDAVEIGQFASNYTVAA